MSIIKDFVYIVNDNLSIDRIDVNSNYEPSNCKWATQKQQARNRSNTIFVEYKGEKTALADVAEDLGMNLKFLEQRYRNGERGERLFRLTEKK